MRINLQSKLIGLIVAIVAVILIVIYSYLNAQLKQDTYNRIRENMAHQLALAHSYFKKVPLKNYEISTIDAVADEIGNKLKSRITIIDSVGKVLGDSNLSLEEVEVVSNHLHRPEIQQALKVGMGESQRFSNTMQMDMLYMAKQYEHGNGGVIRVAIPLSEVNAISSNLKRLLVMSSLLAFVLSIMFGYLAARIISQPISEMANTARQIAKGDFSQKILSRSNDEIGNLAESINHMMGQIKTRIREVTLSKSRLEAVFFSMIEGVMIVDRQGTILLINESLKNILHIIDEPIGRKPLEVIRNIDIQEMTERVLKMDQGMEQKELVFHLPEENIILVHATPVIRAGKTDGAVLVFHNITDLRRLESIRKDFVANVSHELRTPVATIKGYAETLLEGAMDDKEHSREFLEIIYSDSDRLAKLISDLLDLSKIESGKLAIDRKSCSLKQIILKIAQVLQKEIQRKSIDLSINIAEEADMVWVDEASMNQVFLNLIENAVKYNKEGGAVQVTATKDKDFVNVSVKDGGIGIPPDDLPRIFERFYRVDKARSRQMGGTGLGLSIVKHIVQAHGGEVSVESAPDEGSNFRFSLPNS